MLRLVGDVNLTDNYFDVGFGVGSKLAEGFDPFRFIKRDEHDLWVGNFEGVASNISDKKGNDALQFRILPKYIEGLRHMDVYGFSNNHAMQHGIEAYNQTVSTLENLGSKCFGTKNNHTIFIEHQGKTIALTGFSQRIDIWTEQPEYWYNPEYQSLKNEISICPNETYKIAYVHWGNEFINYPSSQQKKFAHWLIDSGFDLVIGMHPHILQGFEIYKGKYVFYSLGNFVFDMAWEPTHYGAIVNVDLTHDNPTIGIDYIKIGDNYSPSIVNSVDVPEKFRFETLNKLVSKEENSEEYHVAINTFYRQYRKANHRDILKKMIMHPSGAFNIIKDYVKRRV